MDNLRNYIRALVDFSTDSWHLLQPALTLRRFKNNELMLQQGQVCDSLFYIDKGYCKSYYLIEGTVKNTGFFLKMTSRPMFKALAADRNPNLISLPARR